MAREEWEKPEKTHDEPFARFSPCQRLRTKSDFRRDAFRLELVTFRECFGIQETLRGLILNLLG